MLKKSILVLLLLYLGYSVFDLTRSRIFTPAEMAPEMTFGRSGGLPDEPGKYFGPAQMRVDSERRRLCFVEGVFWKLIVWNLDTGAHLIDFNKTLAGVDEFYPLNCDFDPKGNLYAIDRWRSQILKISPAYKLLQRWTFPFVAQDIAVDRKGNAYVLDIGAQELVKFNPQGEIVRRFGKGRLQDGGFLAADAEGSIYAVDRKQKKVVVFSTAGRHKGEWLLPLEDPIGNPNIQVQNRKVYISERDHHRIMVFDRHGRALWIMNISAPTVMGVDRQGRIYLPGGGGIVRYQVKPRPFVISCQWAGIRSFLKEKIGNQLLRWQPLTQKRIFKANPAVLLTWGMSHGLLLGLYWRGLLLLLAMMVLPLVFDRLWFGGIKLRHAVLTEGRALLALMREQGFKKMISAALARAAVAAAAGKRVLQGAAKYKVAWLLAGIVLFWVGLKWYGVFLDKLLKSNYPQAEGLYAALAIAGLSLVLYWFRFKVRFTSAGLALLGAGLAAAAQLVVPQQPKIAFLAFLLAGFLLFVTRPHLHARNPLCDFSLQYRPLTAKEIWLLGIVLGAAFVTRFFPIHGFPRGFPYEEIVMAEYVGRVASFKKYFPLFTDGNMGVPSLIAYQGYYLSKVIGWSAERLRLIPQIWDLLTIVAFYILCRRFASRLTAFGATLLFTFSFWHLLFGMRFYPYVPMFFAVVAGLGLFAQGLRKPRWHTFLLAGLACGLSLHSYEAGRGVCLIFLFWMVWLALFQRTWLPPYKLLLVFWAGFAISGAPVIYHAVTDWGNYWWYIQNHANPSRGRGLMSYVEVLWFKIRMYSGVFHFRSGQNPDVQLCWEPMLDPVTGVFFGVGLFICLAGFWRPLPAFLLMYFCAALIPGLVSNGNTPHLRRITLVIPALYLISAFAMERLVQIGRFHLPAAGRRMLAAAILLLIGAAVFFNVRQFYYRFADDPRTYMAWNYREYTLREEMKKYPKAEFHVSRHPHAFFNATAWGIFIKHSELNIYTTFEDTLLMSPAKDHVFYLESYLEAARSFYETHFPHARIIIKREKNMKPEYIDPAREYRIELGASDPVNPLAYYMEVIIPREDVRAFHTLIDTTDWRHPRRLDVFDGEFGKRHLGRTLALTGAVVVKNAGTYTFNLGWETWQLQVDGRPAAWRGQVFLQPGLHFIEMTGRVPASGAGALPLTVMQGNMDVTRSGEVVALLPQPGVHCTYFRQEGGGAEEKVEEYQSLLPFVRFLSFKARLPYSVRCTGSFTVPQSGQYFFQVRSAPSRLWLNGREVFNKDQELSVPTMAPVECKAGQRLHYEAVCPVWNYPMRSTFMLFYKGPDASDWQWVPREWFLIRPEAAITDNAFLQPSLKIPAL
ncbi:glycosyltransferase family 39 protein [candidate division FCPU426 bacterium]|nr:glycosyltransferase family 39 protein [candidate division FCPU426 bacterium]